MITRLVLFLSPALLLTFIPAFAEVTSLQTDRSIYYIDMSIYFNGTVNSADSLKFVNLMIQDPAGKIILMTGGYAGSDGTFHIDVNTNDQNQFSMKGTYRATAFVNSGNVGKTIFFDFSPDGSPVDHVAGLYNGSSNAQSSIGASSQGAKLAPRMSTLVESLKVQDVVNVSKTTHVGKPELPSGSNSIRNFLFPIMAACGAGLIGFIVYQRQKRSRLNSKQALVESPLGGDHEKNDYAVMILKNRLAKGEITLEEFQTIKNALGEP